MNLTHKRVKLVQKDRGQPYPGFMKTVRLKLLVRKATPNSSIIAGLWNTKHPGGSWMNPGDTSHLVTARI